MADLTIPNSDKGYYLIFTIHDSAGTAYNLTGYTPTLNVWKLYNEASPIITGACSIVLASAGTCRYLVTGTDFTTDGVYNAEIELTKAGTIESTETFIIEVKESA